MTRLPSEVFDELEIFIDDAKVLEPLELQELLNHLHEYDVTEKQPEYRLFGAVSEFVRAIAWIKTPHNFCCICNESCLPDKEDNILIFKNKPLCKNCIKGIKEDDNSNR